MVMHYLILFFCKTKEEGKDWNNLQVKGLSEKRKMYNSMYSILQFVFKNQCVWVIGKSYYRASSLNHAIIRNSDKDREQKVNKK